MSTTTTDAVVRKRLSPRKRAQRARIIQYVALGVIVVLGVMFVDGRQLMSVFFRPDVVAKTVGPGLARALLNTLIYTIGAFIVGLLLGTVLALMRLSSVAINRVLASIYIEFFRGVPAIIVFMAFALLPLAIPGLSMPFDPYGAVWIALGLVAGAYMAETIRAGIQAVPKGQLEAARSMGMPFGMATQKIVLPQAFRIVLPPLTNELILLTKDSSLVYVIGLTGEAYELTKYGRELATTYANLTPLVIAGFSYLIITLPLTFLVRRMEAQARKAR